MEKKSMYSDKDEEIDLAGLFKKGAALFKRRLKLFIAFFVAGIICAVTYYNLASPTFKSRMIISSTMFQGPSFVLILENLQMLLKEQNYEALASAMQIDLSDARKIRNIEVYSSKNYAEQEFGDKVSFKDDKLLDKEDVVKMEEFVIEAYVADNSVFKILEKGIIDYLNNNPSMKASSIIKKKGLNDLKNNIEKQRVELDSLKNSIASILNTKEGSTTLFIGQPGAMFLDMIKLYEAEISTAEAISFSRINVIESFRLYKKQSSPKLGMNLIVCTFLFTFFFIITVIILEVRLTS